MRWMQSKWWDTVICGRKTESYWNILRTISDEESKTFTPILASALARILVFDGQLVCSEIPAHTLFSSTREHHHTDNAHFVYNIENFEESETTG